jgi:tetratricopeptide (TPR) repeat protein
MLGVAVATRRACAQTTRAAEATTLHERGIVAFEHGDFQAAIVAFLEADRLSPDSALSYNLGRVYEQLHDDAHALAQYREYLRRAPQAAERKQEVVSKVAALAKRVGAAALQVVRVDATPDEGTLVWIDDEPVGPAPAQLQLPVGPHRARFAHEGFAELEVVFEVTAAAPTPEVRGTLHVAESDANASRDNAPTPASEEAAPSVPVAPANAYTTQTPLIRHLGVATLLAGVGSFGAAIVFEIMRADAAQDASRETEQIRFSQTLDQMDTRQTWARVFVGTGVALAAAGITMLVLSRDQNIQREADNTGLTLDCSPQRCGATFRGNF